MDGDFSFNIAGLVNHSCDANARYDGKGLKIWITADRDIKKSEEITCDYGLVLIRKITSNFLVNVNQKIVVVL